MNRTKQIRQLVETINAEANYVIYIAGPLCNFNVGFGVVEYTVRSFGDGKLTHQQKERVAEIAERWSDVTRAYITKSNQQHVRIAFNSRARDRNLFGYQWKR